MCEMAPLYSTFFGRKRVFCRAGTNIRPTFQISRPVFQMTRPPDSNLRQNLRNYGHCRQISPGRRRTCRRRSPSREGRGCHARGLKRKRNGCEISPEVAQQQRGHSGRHRDGGDHDTSLWIVSHAHAASTRTVGRRASSNATTRESAARRGRRRCRR